MQPEEIAAQLESIARKRRRLDVRATAVAPDLLALPRYFRPSGAGQLIRDIRVAIETLPESSPSDASPVSPRADAKTLLGGNTLTWSRRLEAIYKGGSTAARLWYARYLLLRIATELAALNSAPPTDAFRWLSYHYRLEIDDKDIRHHRLYRTGRAQFLLPDQRVAAIQHYYLGSPDITKSDTRNEEHAYLRRLPEMSSMPGDWWSHFVHLGRRYDRGEEVVLKTFEQYCDEKHQIDGRRIELHLALIARAPVPRYIHTAVRLPKSKISEARPEARIVESPHMEIISREPLTVREDGWVIARFPSSVLAPGLQCGIFFPGLRLYE